MHLVYRNTEPEIKHYIKNLGFEIEINFEGYVFIEAKRKVMYCLIYKRVKK